MRTETENSSPSLTTTSASVAPAFTARATTSAARDFRSISVLDGEAAASGMSQSYQNSAAPALLAIYIHSDIIPM